MLTANSSSIRAVAIAPARHRCSAEQVLAAGRAWLQDDPSSAKLFERFLTSSRAEARHFCIPVERVTALSTISERAAIFEEEGTLLGTTALRLCLEKAGVAPHKLRGLVFTSCSVPAIPSIDGAIATELGCSPSLVRVPVYQFGCAGGVCGLALADRLSRQLGGPVAVLSVELCSLIFQQENHSGGHLVGAAIFGDGASAALVDATAPGNLEFIHSQSFLIPNSRHLMGYDLKDSGWHLRLDKDLPQALTTIAPEVLASFTKDAFSCAPQEIPWWLFHPGGMKILDFLEELVAVPPAQARWARDVLRTYGNLSSSSVLYVMHQFLEDRAARAGDRAVMMGIGPGLTLELIGFKTTNDT